MSLTSVLQLPQVRTFASGLVRNPGLKPKPLAKVPCIGGSPSRMGTAFDYALRFGLAARYETPIDDLVAESAVRLAKRHFKSRAPQLSKGLKRALRTVSTTRWGDELDPQAALACFDLASLDLVYRALYFDDVGRTPRTEEIAEMQALYSIVPWNDFRPRRLLCLNPTFNEGSELVGGADADLLVDDMLVDIKTVKDQCLAAEYVRQLVGYACMANIHGVSGCRARVDICQLAVYFARAGVLHRFPMSDCIEKGNEERYLNGLASAAVRTMFMPEDPAKAAKLDTVLAGVAAAGA